MTRFPAIETRDSLDREEFYRKYVNKRPVVMSGALKEMAAVNLWSPGYLRELAPDLRVRLKTGYLADGKTVEKSLAEYCDDLDDFTARDKAGEVFADPPPYLHDLPLFSMIPALRADSEPFPVALFPRFFRSEWWIFPQFFVGPPQAKTPFHFDTLQTHNLFFQLYGSKRFVIVPARYRDVSYTFSWRWSRVDPENPDPDLYPRFGQAEIFECQVDAGDLLYLPPGTLHQVTSLTTSTSFNVDWHDNLSALRGLTAVTHGMPAEGLRYNALFALGVWTGIPVRFLMPMLKSYFYYIS